MKDRDKTKEQLIKELAEMTKRVAVLETSETEYKRIEKILSGVDEYRLFELLPIGITVLDMKGMILYCNNAVYRKGGYAQGEFTGKHFSKIASVQMKDIHTCLMLKPIPAHHRIARTLFVRATPGSPALHGLLIKD